MKNRVELFLAKMFPPVELSEVSRQNIAAITAQIFEITGSKIVDHGKPRRRKFFLQREDEIGADEAGPSGNDEVVRRIFHDEARGNSEADK